MTAVDTAAFTKAFVEGFAELVAVRDNFFTWSSTFDYTPDQTGLFPMTLPVDSPARAVAVVPIPVSASPARAMSTIGVQFLSRSAGSDVREVWSIDDRIQTALLGLYPVTLPTGIEISTLAWSHGGSLGRDDANRWLWASTFTAGLYRPSTNRQ